jgi:DNA-binding transcriptional regulator YdaS (Cro superfamily)
MKLDLWLQLAEKNCAQFARQVGINQAKLNRFIRGVALPRMESIEEIEKVTGGAVKGEDLLIHWLHIQRQKRKKNATAEGRHE